MSKRDLRVAGGVAAWKVGFWVVVWLVIEVLPPAFNTRQYRVNFHWPPTATATRSSMLKTWDAQHYLYLSEVGYRGGGQSVYFYPLWPMAIRVVAPLFGGNHLVAGLVLANLLSVLGCMLVYRLGCDEYDRVVGETAVLLMLAYPGAIFFSFVYTEALFLVLAVTAMLAVANGRWMLAALAGMLLPLTKALGVVMVLPFAYDLYLDWKRERRVAATTIAVLLSPLAGIGLYLLFMQSVTGDAFTGMRAVNSFIAYRPLAQWPNIVGFARVFLDVRTLHGFQGSVLDRVWFVILVPALLRLWKTNRRQFFYALPMGVGPAVIVSFMSYTRYVLMVFPLFFVAAQWLTGERRRVLRLTVVAIMIAVQAVLLVLHLNNSWVG